VVDCVWFVFCVGFICLLFWVYYYNSVVFIGYEFTFDFVWFCFCVWLFWHFIVCVWFVRLGYWLGFVSFLFICGLWVDYACYFCLFRMVWFVISGFGLICLLLGCLRVVLCLLCLRCYCVAFCDFSLIVLWIVVWLLVCVCIGLIRSLLCWFSFVWVLFLCLSGGLFVCFILWWDICWFV